MSNEVVKPVAVRPVTAPIFPRTPVVPPASVRAAASVPSLVSRQIAQEPAEGADKPVYRFAKLWGVAEVLKFSDGTSYTFRAIRRNNAPGFSPTSSVETSDEKLAENLRKLAKTNDSIREAPPVNK